MIQIVNGNVSGIVNRNVTGIVTSLVIRIVTGNVTLSVSNGNVTNGTVTGMMSVTGLVTRVVTCIVTRRIVLKYVQFSDLRRQPKNGTKLAIYKRRVRITPLYTMASTFLFLDNGNAVTIKMCGAARVEAVDQKNARYQVLTFIGVSHKTPSIFLSILPLSW